MGNSDTPNTAPGASLPEKSKPEQKELLPSEEEEKEDTPDLDIPGMGISSEAPKEAAQEEAQSEPAEAAPEQQEKAPAEQTEEVPSAKEQAEEQEPPILETPAEGAQEGILEDAVTENPKPPDLTPPTPPPPSADQAAPDAQKEEEPYEVPPALGEFLGNQVKDLGIGGQIGLGGSALCLVSSFFWSWSGAKDNPTARLVVWFAVLAMVLLSIEAITLVCLHMPDKLAVHRGRMKDLLFVVAGHIVLLSLLALLLGAKTGPVLSLVGGLAVLAGTYIWLVKSKPAAP